MKKWHLTSPDYMFQLSSTLHGNQIIRHGDDREQQNEEQDERDKSCPALLRITVADCPHPRYD